MDGVPETSSVGYNGFLLHKCISISYSIRLNGVKCGARYCVTRPDGEGEDARARTQHSRVFHKPRFYHSAEYCSVFVQRAKQTMCCEVGRGNYHRAQPVPSSIVEKPPTGKE